MQLERYTGFGPTVALLTGILNFLLGFFLIINSDFGVWAAAVIFPIWFITHCLGKLLNVDFVRIYGSKAQYWVALTVNIIGIVLGVLMLLHPFASAVSMVYIAGFYLLLSGVGSIFAAFGN